jgi:hypothetical protein
LFFNYTQIQNVEKCPERNDLNAGLFCVGLVLFLTIPKIYKN